MPPDAPRTRTVYASGSTGTHPVMIPVAAGGLPDDASIPALAVVARRGIAAVLSPLGVTDASGDEVALLKYHRGKRCAFYAPSASGGVAVKAYASDPEPLVDALTRLERHGLASGDAPTVAPLVAWDRDLRLVVTRWFDAPTAAELVASGAGARAGELAAAWLRRTAGLRDEAAEVFDTRAALRHAHSRARIIARADPRLGAAAQAVAAALAERLPAERPASLTHGSLYAAHVFDLRTGPGVIDWDRFRLAVTESDAGMFEATLTRLSLEPGRAEQARLAVESFRRGIADLADADALRWYRAAALLSLVRRVAGREEGDWRAVGAALLAEAG